MGMRYIVASIRPHTSLRLFFSGSLSSVRIEARQYGESLAGSYKNSKTWNGYIF